MHYSSLAYKQFPSQLRSTSPSEDDYQVNKADRSLSPRRPDYNRLYTAYCKEKYGSKNGIENFQKDTHVFYLSEVYQSPF